MFFSLAFTKLNQQKHHVVSGWWPNPHPLSGFGWYQLYDQANGCYDIFKNSVEFQVGAFSFHQNPQAKKGFY